MLRTNVINEIAETLGAKTYLEVGVRDPHHNFHDIRVESKLGVDPAVSMVENVLPITSDRFFEKNDRRFDLIFIDGDHTYEGVKADLSNALQICDGAIIMHDVHPVNERECLPKKPNDGMPWCGEAWKVFVEARLDGWVGMSIDVDHGVGIILPEKEEPDLCNTEDGIDFGIFRQNWMDWLNVVTVEQAKERVSWSV